MTALPEVESLTSLRLRECQHEQHMMYPKIKTINNKIEYDYWIGIVKCKSQFSNTGFEKGWRFVYYNCAFSYPRSVEKKISKKQYRTKKEAFRCAKLYWIWRHRF